MYEQAPAFPIHITDELREITSQKLNLDRLHAKKISTTSHDHPK
ncbi:hypothetical protein [Streptomyces sp. NPDC049040]